MLRVSYPFALKDGPQDQAPDPPLKSSNVHPFSEIEGGVSSEP